MKRAICNKLNKIDNKELKLQTYSWSEHAGGLSMRYPVLSRLHSCSAATPGYGLAPWYATDTHTQIACIVHQSLASLAPTYLTTDIHLVSEYGRRPLRSSTDRTLTVPRTHNRFGDRSFAVAGTRLWNSLPIRLRQISSYGQFRRYLRNHLFGI